MKVAVVGAGVMGTAAARALAQRSHEVTLFERFEVGHRRGSSHGRSRIFRFSYPDARYVEMMKEAIVLWRDLEARSGVPLLEVTGGLDSGKNLDAHVRALQECEVPHEILPAREIHRRWPTVSLPDRGEVLYQGDGGIVFAETAWRCLFVSAVGAGARIRRERVRSIDPRGIVDVDGTKDRYDAVVVTAGGWTKELLATAGIELDVRPTRETVAFFMMDGIPPTLVDWGDPSVYALPDPGHGIKVGEHIAGPTTDPDTAGGVNEESVARLSEWVGEHFPRAQRNPFYAETCIYTNTPDEHFVLERHDALVVGSACSGHGFKFAPLIGKRLADLVES